MEQLIRQALNDYSRIKAEIAMFERHLEGRENAEMRGALALREIQMGAIESWFRLLDADEKAALRLSLCEGKDNERGLVGKKWAQGLLRAGVSPWKVRESAVEKIVQFANTCRELTAAIFADL